VMSAVASSDEHRTAPWAEARDERGEVPFAAAATAAAAVSDVARGSDRESRLGKRDGSEPARPFPAANERERSPVECIGGGLPDLRCPSGLWLSCIDKRETRSERCEEVGREAIRASSRRLRRPLDWREKLGRAELGCPPTEARGEGAVEADETDAREEQ